MTALIAAAALLLGAGSAATIPVSGPSSTAAVASLELIDPQTWSGRSVPAANGVHFALCTRSLRPCSLRHGALAARRQALQLARRTFLQTDTDLVVVALPQRPTEHALLVFERDVLEAEGDADELTRERLYGMAALVTVGADDLLVLVRLRLPAAAA